MALHGWNLVGLGNPGPKYSGTRHNIGRMFVEEYFPTLPADLKSQFNPVVLGSYMNESGPALRKWSSDPSHLLVLSDDFMIPFGTLRLRSSGSSGGHNGLNSIIETFNTEDFGRLRIGVGPVPVGEDPADFVLESFTSQEKKQFPKIFEAIAGGLKVFVSEGYERAMNTMNKAHL